MPINLSTVFLHFFIFFIFALYVYSRVINPFFFLFLFSSSLTPLDLRRKTYKWSTIRSTVLTSNVLLFLLVHIHSLFSVFFHTCTRAHTRTQIHKDILPFSPPYLLLACFFVSLICSPSCPSSITSYHTMKIYSIDIAR